MEWRWYIFVINFIDLCVDEYKDDPNAFIFTLKNPHGVEPTQFLKNKNDSPAMKCCSIYGPTFGDIDVWVLNMCNNENSCIIENDGRGGYECHPEYRSSLFVNTAGPDDDNYYSILDYEVYTHG